MITFYIITNMQTLFVSVIFKAFKLIQCPLPRDGPQAQEPGYTPKLHLGCLSKQVRCKMLSGLLFFSIRVINECRKGHSSRWRKEYFSLVI